MLFFLAHNLFYQEIIFKKYYFLNVKFLLFPKFEYHDGMRVMIETFRKINCD